MLSAMVDLAALDAALVNAKAIAEGGPPNVPGFGAPVYNAMQDLPTILAHDQYAPRVPRRLTDEIRVARDIYVAALT
jgi:hypothetical protein